MGEGEDRMHKDPALGAEIERLGPWFHNLRIDGIPTAPKHFLGDFPGSSSTGSRTPCPRI